jgi:aspartyl-tRNA(Asn)/glutamyl-tRNA(Gln) amidotransferase subunit A
MNLSDLTLTATAGQIARREISSLALTRAFLARIGQHDPQINAFITVTPDLALRQAEAADRDLEAGNPAGPLHGLPLAVKDLYDTRGVKTTAGSRILADHVPQVDGAVIQKLQEAGAIILGKLNMHEFAFGVTGVNPHYGTSQNPWGEDRLPGGSSSGSGAALAAGLCLGSLGSDTGGSIRIPASFCGVVGLKPTFGRVSVRGVIPLSWHLDHAGPMARRVEDVALLLGVIAGYDPLDPVSADVPVPDYRSGLANGVDGWRVALAEDDYFTQADGEVLDAVQVAAGAFRELGARVDRVPFPGGRAARRANGVMLLGDAATFHADRLKERGGEFGPDILARLKEGAARPVGDYVEARRTQAEIRRQFEVFFESYDLLLTPATPVVAPPTVGPDALEWARQLTRFTAPFNLTGLPALALPCGFTKEGLPVGLQLTGGPWKEAQVLQAAYAYEQATDWHLKKPLVTR